MSSPDKAFDMLPIMNRDRRQGDPAPVCKNEHRPPAGVAIGIVVLLDLDAGQVLDVEDKTTTVQQPSLAKFDAPR